MEWPLIGRESDLDYAMGLVESGTGIALLGAAGVGKSRLLHELVDRAKSEGVATMRVAASESTRTIPFAPFVDLLPHEPTRDRLAMLGHALDSLRSRNGPRGLLLAIDDAHFLDKGSLGLLINAVTSDAAIVCLTARTGESMEPDMVDLWTNGVIERFDLTPLDEAQAGDLTAAVLGSVDEDLRRELWRLSEGNALVLHELIEGAVGGSLERAKDGMWFQRGPLAESPRLADLVRSRLAALPGDLAAAMDLVSVGVPLPLILARATLGSAMGPLEERDLVTVEDVLGETAVLPAHPLYGEILMSHMPEARKQRAYQLLVEASIELGQSVDSLRGAMWQRDSGTLVSGELALRGATAALSRHDAVLAEQLIGDLTEIDDRAAVVLGRALNYQRRFDEAEAVLQGRAPEDTGLVAELASARAHNLSFGLGRVTDAVLILSEAASVVEDPSTRGRLDSERGMVAAIRGDFAMAKEASEAVLANQTSSDVARVSAYVSLSLARAMTADCDGVEDIADEAIDLARSVRQELPLAQDQIAVMKFSSSFTAGRVAEAVRMARSYVSAQGPGGAFRTTWLASLAMGLDLSGLLEEAEAVVRQALALYTEVDPFGLRPQSLGLLAMTRGQRGDAGAIESVAEVDTVAPDPRNTLWIDRGKAWATAARGQPGDAAHIAAEGGRAAIEGQHIAWGSLLLHDAARLGRPEVIVGDLDALDVSKGAHLISTMQMHVRALLDSEAPALLRVGEVFASQGAPLLAAEAGAEAAGCYAAEGDDVAAARAEALSMGWEIECESPNTPALRSRPGVITSREVEVAASAARGSTSRQISDDLFISVRTVDNHLRSVYRKLGVGGREELAEVLSVLENE